MLRGRNVIKVGFVLSMLFPSIESRHQQILFLSISSLQIDSSCCVCAPEIPYVLEALTNISEESLVHFFLNSLWVLTSGFPGGSVGKESACNVGDQGLIPGLGRSPREGNGNPLQYSCLENPMDSGAWQATVHRVTQSQTRLKQLSTHTHI